jgi:seryl-tRNA synthetase
MIDVKDLRENPDKYRRGASLKNVTVDIDTILMLDESRLKSQREFEAARAEQNQASQAIGKLRDPAEKQAAIAKVAGLRDTVKSSEEKAKALEAQIQPLLLQVPQPPDDDVPVGKDAADNVVARKWGEPRNFDFAPKSHIELGEKLGLFDFPRGARLAGSRSYFLTGFGADLHSAVMRFALDMMTREKGFTAMSVPVMVRESAMKGTGFFPAGREQAYRVGEPSEDGEDIRFLTGTAEVALTAFHMDEILAEADLPKKYVAVSTCFRREAGAAGKDTAGLYRVHQFDKCEQVVICRNDVEESKRWHMEMLGYSEALLQRMNLPYRVIACCTGDLGVKNAAMYDVETWMPSREQKGNPESGYGETHSASRLYEFQSRRLNLRYKDKDGKIRFCHTLNNTVVASPRILIPILENYQNADGSVTIPEVLRPYLHGREKIETLVR